MIDEYETDVILAPTRPQMVDLMEDGLDLLAAHTNCTYTVKTKSQGNYEAVVDAGGGMYFQVVMTPDENSLSREMISFSRGHMSAGEFVGDYSWGYMAWISESYASVINVNNGAAWIFCFFCSYGGPPSEYGAMCFRSVKIKSSITGDTYCSGRPYWSSNERQIWPDYGNASGDYVYLPNGASMVYAIDNFDNARYCIPADDVDIKKAMLYPNLITFANKRHLGIPTIGDEPVYWLVREYRITPWREFYVGGTKYVTLGHVAFRSLEREQEEEA